MSYEDKFAERMNARLQARMDSRLQARMDAMSETKYENFNAVPTQGGEDAFENTFDLEWRERLKNGLANEIDRLSDLQWEIQQRALGK